MQDASPDDAALDEPDASRDAGDDAGMGIGDDAGSDGGLDSGLGSSVDAGLDAGVDGGWDGGFDAGRDGGLIRGVDAGLDVGVDGGRRGSVDGGRRSCDEQFGAAPGYRLCAERETECEFYVDDTMDVSCNAVCSDLGSTCVRARREGMGADVCGGGKARQCDTQYNDIVCICSRR